MKAYKKKIADRYDVSGLVEAQFEPGSHRRVLKNLLGIKRKREMDRLEGLEQLRTLREFTPCKFDTIEKTIKALAVVHTELVLIHPFRDGNGRVSRLLATLMALQAELPPLDFSSLKGYRRKAYYIAIRAGLGRDYKPMEDVFNAVIRKSLRNRRI